MRTVFCAALLLGILVVGACHHCCRRTTPREPEAVLSEPDVTSSEPNVAPSEPEVSPAEVPAEMSLFDGKTLGHWKITDFGGQGNVYVKDGSIFLERGQDMTGITWAGPLIRTNYEITLEAIHCQTVR